MRVLFTLLLFYALGAQAQELDKDVLQQVLDGEVYVMTEPREGSRIGRVHAAVYIDAPTSIIWQAMTQCDESIEFVPRMKICEEIEAEGSRHVIRHEIKYFKLWPRQKYVFEADFVDEQQVDFRRLSGDLKHLEGQWRLERQAAGGTLVRYWVDMDPGGFVPKRLVRRALRKDLPELMNALREHVQEQVEEGLR